MEVFAILSFIIYDSGWGIRMLVDTPKSEMYSKDYRDAKSLYRLKMKELKIVDNEI